MIKSTQVAVILALFVSGDALADIVVYSDLGSGNDVYQSGGGGWDITGTESSCPRCDGAFDSAFSFTPTATAYLTELQVALGYVSGTNSVTVDLMTNSNGAPGSIIESWNASGLPSDVTCCTLQTLLSNAAVPLLSGTTYWVAVQPAATDTYVLWQYNSIGIMGPGVYNQGAGWDQNGGVVVGAFQVLGSQSAVPEPDTAALAFTAGLLTLLGKFRKRLRVYQT
jgi:hypothetical protein